jgi:hypothetical protein
MTVKKYPGHETFVFSTPLYSTFSIEKAHEDELVTKPLRVDGYCVECGENRIFRSRGDESTSLV